MTKAELIEKMADDAGITKVAAGDALQLMVDGITKALKKKDGKVTLVGFGTFKKVQESSVQNSQRTQSCDRRVNQDQGP